MEKSKGLQKFTLFIIGTTAVGKTKMSLQIGSKFQGEIVSCDSMQIYKDCNIMTAKVTKEEQNLVRHHMIDILDLDQTNFNRNHYFHQSQKFITQIFEANKFPIIVGGTHYYTETIMFDQKIPSNDKIGSFIISDPETEQAIKKLTPEQKFAKLQSIDPILCLKLHPNNQKRVESYLLQALEQNERPSSHMENLDDVGLRNLNSLIFWPVCKNVEILNQFQMKRIREMIEKGGLDEIFRIMDRLLKQCSSESEKDLEQGVLQSIGYKEFVPFYEFTKKNGWDWEKSKQDQEGAKILENCVQRLYINTVKFSKSQVKWIQNRIMVNKKGEEIRKRLYIFPFETYETEQYNQLVLQPSIDIIEEYFKILNEGVEYEKALDILAEKFEQFLVNEDYIQKMISKIAPRTVDGYLSLECKECNILLKGEDIYKKHMNSNKHLKRIEALERQKQMYKTILENGFQCESDNVGEIKRLYNQIIAENQNKFQKEDNQDNQNQLNLNQNVQQSNIKQELNINKDNDQIKDQNL